jgi:polyvinyl alcohol dehydrogenase (cytochrome)
VNVVDKVSFNIVLALMFCCGCQIASADNDSSNQWLFAGKNIHNTRSSDNSNITSKNVSHLTQKWVFQTNGDISATPTVEVVKDAKGHEKTLVYVVDWGNESSSSVKGGYIHCIDGDTGTEKWSKNLAELTGISGALSRTSPAIVDDQLVIGLQPKAVVVVLDKKDGHLIWQKQIDDHPAAYITQSPMVFEGMIYQGVASGEEGFAANNNYKCCSFRGSMVALKLKNGDIKWKTYTVPTGYSGGAVWGSTPAIDPSRKALYFTTGNNYTTPQSVLDCLAGDLGKNPGSAKTCIDPTNYFDSIISVNLNNGKVNWAFTPLDTDFWNVGCLFAGTNCPANYGPDADFGQGPGLFSVKVNGKLTDLVGAGQKSGIYWAVSRDGIKANGNVKPQVIWSTQVGPGGTTGGLQWGSAVHHGVVYTALSNSGQISFQLPNGTVSKTGGYAALNGTNGNVLWQIPDPNEGGETGSIIDYGPVSVVNDVFLACSMTGYLYAINAHNGQVLWYFSTGSSSCNNGPSIVGNTIYWGTGYSNFGLGKPGNKLYAFELPPKYGVSEN